MTTRVKSQTGSYLMLDYQLRVVEEKDELGTRIELLQSFMSGSTFSSLGAGEQVLLSCQRACMVQYHSLLMSRIQLFKRES